MTITTEFVTFVLLVLAAVGGAWWRIEGRIKTGEKEASVQISAADAAARLLAVHLAEYKLHVAEAYVTKSGLRETTEQIMAAIGDVKSSMNGLNQRLDRIIEERGQK